MKGQRVRTRNSIAERLSSAGLSPQEDAVRKAILTAFANEGKAPSVPQLAPALGLPLAPVLAACRTLAAHDLIVWREDERQIVSAYPFSGVPTAHHVRLPGRPTLYAMCAIDALGIPFMLCHGARIRSACFFCHQPVSVETDGGLLQRAAPSTLVVLVSEQEGTCVAEARCPLMNFFCDEGHLHAWRSTAPQETGTSLSVTEAIEAGKAAFGELLT